MAGTIYGMAFSTCTQRIYAVVHELGLEKDVKLVPINLMTGEQKTPDHLARHPFGKVPAYESADGVKLFESRAISRYIDAKSGGKLSHRDNLAEWALIETWTSVETSNFDKHASVLTIELVFHPMFGKPVNQEEVDKNKAALSTVLDVYETELANRKYLAGNSLTLADLYHLPFGAHTFKVLPELLENRPNVKRWFESLTSLPSWQKTLAMSAKH